MSNVTPLFPDPPTSLREYINATIDMGVDSFERSVAFIMANGNQVSDDMLRQLLASYRRMAGLARTSVELHQ